MLDILKTLAVVLMVIDHIGAFVLTDEPLWRAVGRWCVPLWLVLAGYARPRKLLDLRLIAGGVIVGVCHTFIFADVLPLNVLFSILAIHAQTLAFYEFRPLWERWPRAVRLASVCLYCVVLIALIPVITQAQYGTLALLLGLCGLVIRDKALLQPRERIVLAGLVGMAAIQSQIAYFHFATQDAVICGLGMAVAMYTLWRVDLTQRFPPHQSIILRLGGRYTLEFYVIHFILIAGVAYIYMSG